MRDKTMHAKRRPVHICRSAMGIERRRSAGLFWWLLALALLALFGILAARTDGARQLIENRLQRHTGLMATVNSSGIGWPYDLVLTGVTLSEKTTPTGSADGERQVLRLEELRLGLRLRRGASITVRGAQVTLYSDDDDRPQPSQWAKLADIEDAGALAAWLVRLFGNAARVELEQVSIEWRDAENRMVTAAQNIRLLSLPLQVPDRSWRYFDLSADRIHRADGRVLTGLQQEWLVSGESSLIQLGYCVAGEHPGLDVKERIR